MRLTSIFIVIIILFSSISIPIYADETEDAIKLQTIGILKGSGNGVDEAYRSSEPMRYQAAWLFLRLLGKESAAKAWTGTLNFFDSATAKTSTGNTLNSENKTMLAYLYAHQNLGFKGFPDDSFRPFEKINAQQYYKLMLVALGYEENTDFTWDTVFKSAARFGLSTEVENNNTGFNIDKLARITVAALNANLKSTERTLIAKLIEDDKSIDITKAAQAGLYGDIVVPETEEPTTNPDIGILTSVEIGKLADAVVYIGALGYDGSKWSGSGFYISQDGNFITNYHVIDGAKTLTIVEKNGQTYTGNIKILGYDVDNDIALLDIDKTVALYFVIGDSNKIILGDEIYAIGYPLGVSNTLSNGLVSSIWNDGSIQITAPISHGSSGGVLLNNKGEAIGITYAIIEEGANLGFAIPINKYKEMPKNLQISLDNLYYQIYTSQIQPPTNIYLTQVDSQSYDIKWSNVADADYYYVYESTSLNGTYRKLSSSTNNGQWDIRGVSCSGRTTGVTYYIKVTAVKNGIESSTSNVASITLKNSGMYRNSSTLTYTAVTGYPCLWSYSSEKKINVDWYDPNATLFGYTYTSSGFSNYSSYLLSLGYYLYDSTTNDETNTNFSHLEFEYLNNTTGEYIVLSWYYNLGELWIWIDE